MSDGFPISAKYADMTQFDRIQCVHPKSGLVMTAQRIVKDGQTPIRWMVVVEGSTKEWRDLGEQLDGTRETYSTDELNSFAKNAGFGEWQLLPIDMVPAYPWNDLEDPSKKQYIPKYPLPDPTPVKDE